MPIPPPPVLPIRVEFITPEPLWYGQWDFWVSVGTLIVAAMTGWYAWETRRLRKGSDNAVAAAQQSADAAVRSVDVSQESMQRSLRAYVIVEGIEILGKNANQIPSQINVCVVNTGQTPACRLELFYDFAVLKAFPTSMITQGKATLSQSDIGRDQRRKCFTQHGHTQSDIQEINSGTSFLMAYGCVRYYDVFLDEPRYTYFSYAWDANSQFFYPAGPMNTLS